MTNRFPYYPYYPDLKKVVEHMIKNHDLEPMAINAGHLTLRLEPFLPNAPALVAQDKDLVERHHLPTPQDITAAITGAVHQAMEQMTLDEVITTMMGIAQDFQSIPLGFETPNEWVRFSWEPNGWKITGRTSTTSEWPDFQAFDVSDAAARETLAFFVTPWAEESLRNSARYDAEMHARAEAAVKKAREERDAPQRIYAISTAAAVAFTWDSSLEGLVIFAGRENVLVPQGDEVAALLAALEWWHEPEPKPEPIKDQVKKVEPRMPRPSEIENQINQAYQARADALGARQAYKAAVAEAKNALARAKYAARQRPEWKEQKNEDMRADFYQTHCQAEIASLEEAEAADSLAALRDELTALRVEHVRAILRIRELEAMKEG